MNPLLFDDGPIFVVAPHPDDEVLGVGGTIARLSDAGREVHVVVVTRGQPPAFPDSVIAQVRTEAKAAHDLLGVAQTHWLDLPAAQLGEFPHSDVNHAIGTLIKEVAPSTLFLPHPGDIHLDHQLVFLSSLVGARPYQDAYPAAVYAYETLSETNWNAPYLTPPFVPNTFVDISDHLERKLAAFALYASQVKPAPHERSLDALRALAVLRGATVHRAACEGFVLVRQSL